MNNQSIVPYYFLRKNTRIEVIRYISLVTCIDIDDVKVICYGKLYSNHNSLIGKSIILPKY